LIVVNPAQPLESIGFDAWFDRQARSAKLERSRLARVIAVDRGQHLLLNESGVFRAKFSGRFRYESDSGDAMPAVGDWVEVERGSDDQYAMIDSVLPRKSFLRRKAPGHTFEYQMIAANIDTVFIVQSCHFDFNINRLERYLVMVADGGASPVILLTKTDLVTADELDEMIDMIRESGITTPLYPLSNVTGEGVAEVEALLVPGRTYCFVGSSGIGKSTMINGLIGEERLATREVSDTGEGIHTTVRRELIVLPGGAMVIDNPGMREFGVMTSDEAIEESFSDIEEIAQQCRFRDCSHTSEPGCAVLRAVEDDIISIEHLDNYLKLDKESRFNQLSRVEKREKDKSFGKFIKKAKKDLKRR